MYTFPYTHTLLSQLPRRSTGWNGEGCPLPHHRANLGNSLPAWFYKHCAVTLIEVNAVILVPALSTNQLLPPDHRCQFPDCPGESQVKQGQTVAPIGVKPGLMTSVFAAVTERRIVPPVFSAFCR